MLTLGYVFMRGMTWHGSATLHTVMEAVATFLALTVGAMALVRFYSKKNNTFLFLGTGFLGTAFLDGYHTVVTSVAFKPFMPTDLPHLIPWSWVASRQFLSVFLFLSLMAWLRERRLGNAGRISERSVYLFTAIFTLLCFIFFAFAPLPRAYYPELMFHRPEEFLPALFFLAALVGYLHKGEWRHDTFEHWLVLSIIVGFIGQAVFMSFSGELFDLEFDAAHTLKQVSYVCVLTGLLANMYVAFKFEADRVEASHLMNCIAVAANQSSNTEDTFTYCLKQICSFMGWNVGHVYVPMEDGSGRLLSSRCWYSTDDERFRVFRDASFNMICEDGLIGRVFKSAKSDWVASVVHDPNYRRVAAAAETGLQGSVAFPVGIRDEIVAVFEFYSLEPIEAVKYSYGNL